jgi:hypothetical protein
MDTRNLQKTVKVAFRMKDKIVYSPDEVLKWIKNLSPRLCNEHWRVLYRPLKSKGQRLLLLTDRDSFKVTKEISCKIFTGLPLGIIKVLSDPVAGS